MNLLYHKSGRRLIAFGFYFAEGAPIGFIWWALPTLLRQKGVEISTITSLTALFTLPWVFKFLWAPLIDVFRSSRFGYTKIIAWSQLLMCLTLLPLLFIPMEGNLMWWGILLFSHSLCAATQDVTVDALVINVVAKQEKGMLNGFMQAGMLAGRSLFGGAALIFIPIIGLTSTVAVMTASILGIMLLLLFIEEPAAVSGEKTQLKNFNKNLIETFQEKQTWYTIFFALTAAAAFEAAGGMSGAFLIDKKMDMESIGFFFAVPVIGAMILGGFVGGFLSDIMSRKKSIIFFLIGFVFLIALVSVNNSINPHAPHFMWIALFTGMYFFTGMFTSSSYALFMDVTNPKLAATEFSTFMAATNGCESWAVWSAGILAASQGYSVAFLAMCLVSLLSLFFLREIKN